MASSSSNSNKENLTKDQVYQLINERSAENSAVVVDTITKYYNDGNFSSEELKLVNETLLKLSYHAEMVVRKTISQNLCANPDIPHELAIKLANDVNEVSLPILEFSTVLSDQDLRIIIARSQDMDKHIAISKRPVISEGLSESIISNSNEEAVSSLLHNKGSYIEDKSMEKIIAKFSDSQTVIEELVTRDNVPVYIKEKLMAKLSDQIKEYLVDRYNIDSKSISKITNQGKDTMILGMLPPNASLGSISNLVDHLDASNKLDIHMIIMAIASMRISFAEVAFARKANVPIKNAATLLKDSLGLGFESLYRKVNFPELLMEAMSKLTHAAYLLMKKHKGNITEKQYMQELLGYLNEHYTIDSINGMSSILNKINEQIQRLD